MRFGLDVSQHHLLWDEILDRVRFAEEVGFEGAWVFDHFKPLYGSSSGPCFEGWTLLAALAASTEKIRLGTLVTGITYRHPSILTTEAVTVDHVSNGRLEFAVGAAWFEGEHNELGLEFPGARERIARLDEAIDVMRLLMTASGAGYDGRYYQLRDADYGPKPVQKPHPPIWVGGGGEKRMLPLVARQADVWHGFGDVAGLTRKSKLIDEHAGKANRDPSSIVRATSLSLSEDWSEVRGRLDALDEVGFSYFTVSWPSEGKGRLEEFVTTVMPDYAEAP
jgi:F420-dependent oxidoreductase-like protein